MDGVKIRELINFNNRKIEEMLDPSTFVLQPEVQKLLDENQKLREQCDHVVKDGTCIYCGMTWDSLK